ncbi:SOS response-associated peptidase [Fulvivirga lutea]|uniref:Abasic site processing protein n=1 Tax=Fulvivirga lutea TaxID=2810512 RepID=A0A975A0C8_9BACT|nr:SOS response-associated peptidase [Fulvivirga lutea]QSE97060.1 SOS response-associated peptidase [Fulvivirga lutea]
MGDRYTITALASVLSQRFNVEVTSGYKPKYNAAPTQLLPIITQGSKGISYFYWGQIPDWSNNKPLSNKLLFGSIEEITQKASLAKSLTQTRCIIPMDGYYEWKRISKKGRVAHRIIFGDNEIIGVAGLWEEFEGDEGEMHHTFKILTTSANEAIEPMNTRMPAIIERDKEEEWLKSNASAEELISMISPYPANKIHIYSVSPKIEDIKNEGEHLIKPFAPADQFGNYSLFD